MRAAPRRRRRARAHHSVLARYFTGAFGLRPSDQLAAGAVTVGSHVLAGTILGRLAHTTGSRRPHLIFELRPVGVGEAPIDPRRSSTPGRSSRRSSCTATASTRRSSVPTCTP
jgi:hypothetical protein